MKRLLPGCLVALTATSCEWLFGEAFYLYRPGAPGEEWSVDLLSEDSLRVRRWRLGDRTAEGKQFFREADWRFRSEPIGRSESLRLVWVFDVAGEDLQPVE